MRIVVNGWFWNVLSTGSGQYLAALVEQLPRVGEAHQLIVVRHSPGAAQHALPSGWQGRDLATPFDRLSTDVAKLWFEQVGFPRACRRLKADVALVPYWGSPWLRPCPVVVTIHDLIPLLLAPYRGGPLQRAYSWLVARTARRADAVLTDSEASRCDVVARLGIPAGRVHAVHLAAAHWFHPPEGDAALAHVRTRYALGEGPFLLYLGGFDARKNVVRMLEAYAGLIRRLEAQASVEIPRFVIAGRVPEHDTAFAPDPRAAVRRLGIEDRVHFTGWVEEADKPALYALALATVFVSEYEGFGLPVLEAMACAN